MSSVDEATAQPLVDMPEETSSPVQNEDSAIPANTNEEFKIDVDDVQNAEDSDNSIYDDDEEPLVTPDTPVRPATSNPLKNVGQSNNSSDRMMTSETNKPWSFSIHNPLLKADVDSLCRSVSPGFLTGISYEPCAEDSSLLKITLHLFTNFIETETACQWQVCNKRHLTCLLHVNNELYLDDKVVVYRVYQHCDCHPANAIKIPFIERLIRDYFEKVQIPMNTLKLSRATLDPNLRAQCFLELLSDERKREQYKEMLTGADNSTLLDELLEYEILDANESRSRKFSLLKVPRTLQSKNVHYDLINPKNYPPLHNGYLVQFCQYLEYRMRNLNSLCVMCGRRTFDVNDKRAAKPTICDDYSCFSDAMDSKFRNDPLPPSIFSIEIADFLLLLVYAAIKSARHELILDPYPKLINPYNTSTTLLDENGDKQENIVILQKIVDDLVSMGSITQYEVVKGISLRSMIELKHPWGFSFFHWLMGTNRYHFSLIPSENQLQVIQTKHQYFIKHEDITKHVNFKRLRAEKGSIFAFHGSPQENWHAILRAGLQIGKGGYLLNGAAYGSGIYVSPSFEFSSTYATNRYRTVVDYSSFNPTPSEPTPLQQRNWSCIALCEIINSPDVYKKHSNDIWTIQDPNLICTRFIFFFPLGLSRSSLRVDNDTEAANLHKLIHTLNNLAC